MSVKTTIAAVAAFVAVAAAPGLASAQTKLNAYAHQTFERPTLHRHVLKLPADVYGYAGSGQEVRPSQQTGGQGHDFQLEGRF
jgi:hypothetical protein